MYGLRALSQETIIKIVHCGFIAYSAERLKAIGILIAFVLCLLFTSREPLMAWIEENIVYHVESNKI